MAFLIAGRTRPPRIQDTKLAWSLKPRASSFPELLKTAALISVVGLFVLAAIAALDVSRAFLLPVTAALLIGLTLGPTVERMENWRIPPYAASGILICGLVGILYGIFYLFAAPADEWIRKFPQIWERLADQLRVLQVPLQQLNDVSESVEKAATGDADKSVKVTVQSASVLTNVYTTAPAVLGQFAAFLGTLFFFMANRTRLRAGLLSFCMTRRLRLRTARIVRDIEYFLSRYVTAITIVNVALGLSTWLAMYLLDMPSPALWGVMAALLNYIPYLGPAVVALALVGVGLVTFDETLTAMTPALVYFGLNMIESQLVTPGFVGRSLTLNPLLIFLSLAFWMWLWGPLGALLAVPLLIVTVVMTIHLLPRRGPPAEVPFGKPGAVARKQTGASGTEEAQVVEEGSMGGPIQTVEA